MIDYDTSTITDKAIRLERLIISAPFGNYLWWDGWTPTLGTFTEEYRGGFMWRLWKVLSSVRYYPGIGAWKNKLGLPNPGIGRLIEQCYIDSPKMNVKDKIVSISARNLEKWYYVLTKARFVDPLMIEMNVSCPNCGDMDTTNYNILFKLIKSELGINNQIIVKLPPLGYERFVELAIEHGIHWFHCCNTLPIIGNNNQLVGGLSGKPLKPLSLAAIRWIRKVNSNGNSNKVNIIGGGGITNKFDILEYSDAGADHFAVGSALFNPFRWRKLKCL
jgi:dihydroorotate dehydrogenase